METCKVESGAAGRIIAVGRMPYHLDTNIVAALAKRQVSSGGLGLDVLKAQNFVVAGRKRWHMQELAVERRVQQTELPIHPPGMGCGCFQRIIRVQPADHHTVSSAVFNSVEAKSKRTQAGQLVSFAAETC